MKTKVLRWLFFLILFSNNLFSSLINAQPPAQGPPLPPLPGVVTNELGNYIIIDLLKTTIQINVDTINAIINRQSETTKVKAHLSFTSKVFKPSMSATTLTDQPNQNVVRIPFMIEYTVSDISYNGIPYFSRKINQSIAVSVSCRNWFAPPGNIHITTTVEKPYLDNATFSEQAVNYFIGNLVSDFVDSKIRQILPGAFSTYSNAKNSPCSCLGIESGDAPDFRNGSIKYSYKKPFAGGGGGTSTGVNNVVITLKSIKRLPARSTDGQILYNPSENIQLELYGNNTLQTSMLDGFNEGEERLLNVPAIIVNRPANDGSVILIANITQLPAFTKDTRFSVLGINTNFGNGTHKLVIQKSYWEKAGGLPGGKVNKPVERKVNAYELTIQIDARPNSAQPDNRPGPVRKTGPYLKGN
jgi:hypothetical protein